jgi:hypothetical protein
MVLCGFSGGGGGGGGVCCTATGVPVCIMNTIFVLKL